MHDELMFGLTKTLAGACYLAAATSCDIMLFVALFKLSFERSYTAGIVYVTGFFFLLGMYWTGDNSIRGVVHLFLLTCPILFLIYQITTRGRSKALRIDLDACFLFLGLSIFAAAFYLGRSCHRAPGPTGGSSHTIKVETNLHRQRMPERL